MNAPIPANQILELNERIENAIKQARHWNDIASELISQRDALQGKPVDPNSPEGMAARALDWMQTPEGQESMRKAAARSKAFADKLRAARNIPWEKLHEPFTI